VEIGVRDAVGEIRQNIFLFFPDPTCVFYSHNRDVSVKMDMFLFLIPLLVGFVFNSLSAFTAEFSRRFGDRVGSLLTILLRDVLGIPVWAAGFFLAAWTSSPFLFKPAPGVKAAGWILIAAGGLIILAALVTIRLRSMAPSTRDSLAQSGIYDRVRHPIHSGTFLEFLGVFLVRPSVTVGLACALGVIWVLIQTMCEERDLLQRIPEYREYMDRVPRFFPRIR
jgi:protein-S-isoprenylcysteine O-methyltransferase Ste14